MKKCCQICSTANCARLLHFSLTVFVFYVLLLAPNSDLHRAWQKRTLDFFIILFLYITSSLLYLIASLMDPGYIKLSSSHNMKGKGGNGFSLYKLDDNTINDNKISLSNSIGNKETEETAPSSNPKTSSRGKYCSVCDHTGLLRVKHCKLCERCVRKFDHHCPWLGNCVGERNHRFFWLFLAIETPLLIWGVFVAWSSLQSANGLLTWLRVNILTFPSLFIVVIGSIAVCMLFVFHSFLLISGQTTWELASRFTIPYLKTLDPPINPFDEGCILNCVHFIFCPSQDWDSLYDSKTSGGAVHEDLMPA